MRRYFISYEGEMYNVNFNGTTSIERDEPITSMDDIEKIESLILTGVRKVRPCDRVFITNWKLFEEPRQQGD